MSQKTHRPYHTLYFAHANRDGRGTLSAQALMFCSTFTAPDYGEAVRIARAQAVCNGWEWINTEGYHPKDWPAHQGRP